MTKKKVKVARGPDAEAIKDKVALLAGGGRSTEEIAVAIDRTERRVSQILQFEITPERKMLMEEARARVQEKALKMIEDNLESMNKGFGEANLGHQAQAVRVLGELGVVGGYSRGSQVAAPPVPALQVNFGDAATVASFVQALRMLNEPSGPVIEVQRES